MSSLRMWSWNLSPFAGKARVAFAEKGVEVELIEIDPRARPARLRELNPTGRVPVLETPDGVIRESTVICEWLEDTHPEHPLWPADPVARAHARGLLRWVDDELTTNFFLSLRKQVFGIDESSDHPDIVDVMQGRLIKRWPVLEALLNKTDGPWLAGGEEPTFADLGALPLAVRLPQWRPDLAPQPEEHPAAHRWMTQLRERPSAAEVDRQGEPAPA